jgi:hypothetical protein
VQEPTINVYDERSEPTAKLVEQIWLRCMQGICANAVPRNRQVPIPRHNGHRPITDTTHPPKRRIWEAYRVGSRA